MNKFRPKQHAKQLHKLWFPVLINLIDTVKNRCFSQIRKILEFHWTIDSQVAFPSPRLWNCWGLKNISAFTKRCYWCASKSRWSLHFKFFRGQKLVCDITLNCILVYDSITESTPDFWTKFLSIFFSFNKQYILVCHSCKEIDNHAKRYAACSSHSRRKSLISVNLNTKLWKKIIEKLF